MPLQQRSLVAFLAIVAIYRRHQRRRIGNPVDVDYGVEPPPAEKSGAVRRLEVGDRSSSSTSSAPFPWEPRRRPSPSPPFPERRPHRRAAGLPFEDARIPTICIKDVVGGGGGGSGDDDEGLIRLLAGMTFANGGLRMPSCPCCR